MCCDGRSPITRKLTGRISRGRHTESAFAQTTIPTNIHTANIFFTNIILMADKHDIPKGKMSRSPNEQGRVKRVHCIMFAVFSVARPHSDVASLSKYLHFCLCSLLYVNTVHSRFSHLHVVHRLLYPLAILVLRLTVTLCGVVCIFLNHSLHRMILEVSLLQCVVHREWDSLVSCLVCMCTLTI